VSVVAVTTQFECEWLNVVGVAGVVGVVAVTTQFECEWLTVDGLLG